MKENKRAYRLSDHRKALTLEGKFSGGPCPYGYELVYAGRHNVHGEAVLDLRVSEAEAPVVRHIFHRYVYEGYGVSRLSKALDAEGIWGRNETPFHPNTLHYLLQNPVYTGILHTGTQSSPHLPQLQIISNELFDLAQEMRKERYHKPRITSRETIF